MLKAFDAVIYKKNRRGVHNGFGYLWKYCK